MAQGKEWNRQEVIEALEPLFKMGMSVTKACKTAGIPQSTVQTWIGNDEALRLKIGVWQTSPSRTARANWLAKMEEGDFAASKEWLERKEKDEFSTRQETTGADGGAIEHTVNAAEVEKALDDVLWLCMSKPIVLSQIENKQAYSKLKRLMEEARKTGKKQVTFIHDAHSVNFTPFKYTAIPKEDGSVELIQSYYDE